MTAKQKPVAGKLAKPAPSPLRGLRIALWIAVAAAALGVAVHAWQGGGRLAASRIGGPFSLVDQHGATVTEAELRGHPSLMFFGYTFCPDVCPTTLFEAGRWLKQLGPDGDRLKVYFVTVDPERDTGTQLANYLQAFDPRIVGLTGARAALDPMLRSYRVYWNKVGDGDDYAMEHTAAVYMLDGEGDLAGTFSYQDDEAAIMAKIRRLTAG